MCIKCTAKKQKTKKNKNKNSKRKHRKNTKLKQNEEIHYKPLKKRQTAMSVFHHNYRRSKILNNMTNNNTVLHKH